MRTFAEGLHELVPFEQLLTIMVNPTTHEAPPPQHVFQWRPDSPKILSDYQTHYSKIDPVFPWAERNRGVPSIFRRHVEPNFLDTSEFGEFLRSADVEDLLGINLSMPDGWTLIYSVQRPKGMPHFSERDLAIARLVGPDLEHAAFSALLHERIGAIATPGQDGMVVFTESGEIVRIDDSARVLLDDLLVDGLPTDLLVSSVRALKERSLERTIRLAAGGWVRITFARSSEGGGDVVAHVRRMTPGSEIFDAEADRAGLTVREREVAQLASKGAGTREIAHALGTSPATVKHQLSSVYRKTRTTSRTELTALLVGGVHPRGHRDSPSGP
ncbi:MAG: helix-turn-helix transcriptional regulator [Planctomycetota bacterium]